MKERERDRRKGVSEGGWMRGVRKKTCLSLSQLELIRRKNRALLRVHTLMIIKVHFGTEFSQKSTPKIGRRNDEVCATHTHTPLLKDEKPISEQEGYKWHVKI